MRIAILTVAAVLGACAPEAPLADDTDLPETLEAGDPTPVACPDLMGIRDVGTRWAYVSPEHPEFTLEWTTEVVGLEEGDGWARFQLEGAGHQVTTQGDELDYGEDVTILCDSEGGRMERRLRWTESKDGAGSAELFEPGVLLVPRDVQVGDSFETVFLHGAESPWGIEDPVESVLGYTVVSEEEVVVPAGTFTALRFHQHQGSLWPDILRAPGTGTVLFDGERELVEYVP